MRVSDDRFCLFKGRIIGGQNITLMSGATVNGFKPNTPVPEPTTMILLGTGLVGIAAKLRKRRSQKQDTED